MEDFNFIKYIALVQSYLHIGEKLFGHLVGMGVTIIEGM